MKKMILFAVFIITCNYYVYAEKIPTFFFDFGTKRSDIIFEFGEPKYHIPGGHLLYETYTSARTLETTVFLMDEGKKLTGITVDIGIDYASSLPRNKHIRKAYEYYGKIFTKIYGKPYIANKINAIWKFDNGFSVFVPYKHKKNGDQRFKFICFPKEATEGTVYDVLFK